MIPTNSPTRARTMPKWGWLLVIGCVIALLIVLPSVGIVLSLTVIGFAIFALVKKTPTLLRFGSAKRAMLASSVAVVALFISGVAATAAARPDPVAPAALLDTQQSAAPAKPAPTTATADAAKPAPATAEAAPTPADTPAPAPEPVTVVSQVSESQVIAYGQQRVDDANFAQGTEQVTVAGANGERVITYEITTVDGVETARTVISDVVTLNPTDEVVSVGTYVEPAKFAEVPAADDGCNPNYADACVPNDPVDVDCAGGGGNGPSYFDGVARVVGSDVYKLDADGDGYACEP